jgi:biopolymer transport protein ExbD
MGIVKSAEKKDFSQPRPASFIPSQGPAIGLPSPLGSAMTSQKSTARKKQDMSTPLLLTALVDAFSILVIFLLVQVSGAPNTFEADDKIKLPQASSVDLNPTAEDSTLVKSKVLNLVIRGNGYILNGENLDLSGLRSRLLEAGKIASQYQKSEKTRLVIQADENNEFDLLAPVLGITAEAGISSLDFAVQAVTEGM